MRLFSKLFLGYILAALPLTVVYGKTYTLFDGTLDTTPSVQGWVYIDSPLFSSDATQAMTGNPLNSINMNSTSSITDSAGYSNFFASGFPILSRSKGFHLNFGVEVISETHNNIDRGGFSIIALSDDNVGLELTFWQNEIWAQNDNPLFTHGEGVSHDTSKQTLYNLSILTNKYELRADGNLILNGVLRDYSAHTSPVYSQANFLFFGDDTSSAQANINLDSFSVSTVPLPAGWGLFSIGLLSLYYRKRKLVTTKK